MLRVILALSLAALLCARACTAQTLSRGGTRGGTRRRLYARSAMATIATPGDSHAAKVAEDVQLQMPRNLDVEAPSSSDGSTVRNATESRPTQKPTPKPKPKPAPPKRKFINKPAIDVMLEDPELTTLADQLHMTGLAEEKLFKKVAISVFAPTDPVFAALPIDMNALDFPGKLDILGEIINYHTFAPKLLRPEQIREGKPFIGKTRNKQKLSIERHGPKDTDLTINGYAKVIDVIGTKKGFIYKVDSVLYPRWNDGPTLVDFVRETPWLSKTLWLMEKSGMADDFALAGPVTALFVPDEGWVTPNGVEVPHCFFEALVREENVDVLKRLLGWLILPGVYNSTDIQHQNSLINAEGPPLSVAHVRSPEGGDSFTFVEGKQVKTWDISVYNGMIHILSELPFRADLDLSMALWDCSHDLCFQCPKIANYILRYFDNGGVLPGDEPEEHIVPPGPRPSWVCQGVEKWFPPGWNEKKWKNYLKAAKKGSDNAQKLAQKGWTEAAVRLTKLQEELDRKRLDESHLQAKQDWSAADSAVKPGRDPSMNIMGRLNRMARPFPDCKHKDNVLQLTTNDLRYITRWQ